MTITITASGEYPYPNGAKDVSDSLRQCFAAYMRAVGLRDVQVEVSLPCPDAVKETSKLAER